jgi:hypothetical protein
VEEVIEMALIIVLVVLAAIFGGYFAARRAQSRH